MSWRGHQSSDLIKKTRNSQNFCLISIFYELHCCSTAQQVHAEGESSSEHSATSFPFPASDRKQRNTCGAQCHREVKAGRIRKGQEHGSQLQGNKGKPIPLGIILTLETGLSTQRINEFLWEEKERSRGPEQDIAPRKVCHAVSKLSLKLWGILFPVQMFYLNVHMPILAGCQCHTYQGSGCCSLHKAPASTDMKTSVQGQIKGGVAVTDTNPQLYLILHQNVYFHLKRHKTLCFNLITQKGLTLPNFVSPGNAQHVGHSNSS